MSEGTPETAIAGAPWHLWVIGALALLWYASGAYVIQTAQLGIRPEMPADEVAYYAAQPLWFQIVTGVSTYGSVIGSLLLLVRNRLAVPVFAIALGTILLTNAVDLVHGTSRVYANTGAAAVTCFIVAIAIFMVWYSRAMRQRGVLR